VTTSSEAILNYRIPLVGPEAPARAWQEVSRNQIWSARHPASDPPFGVIERFPEGAVRLPDRERTFHIIPAGRSHHIEHGFGFWRTCGADALYIKSAFEGGMVYMMVVSTAAEAYVSDTIGWSCLTCGRALQTLEIPTRRIHLRGLLERSLAAVRDFNASVTARTCSECGTLHPLAYGFEPEEDTVEERAARSGW